MVFFYLFDGSSMCGKSKKNLKNLILDLKIKKTHIKESFFTTNIPFVTKHVCKYRTKSVSAIWHPTQEDVYPRKLFQWVFCFYNPSTFKSSFLHYKKSVTHKHCGFNMLWVLLTDRWLFYRYEMWLYCHQTYTTIF